MPRRLAFSSQPSRPRRTANCRRRCRHLCCPHENPFALWHWNLHGKNFVQLPFLGDEPLRGLVFGLLHHRQQIPDHCSGIHFLCLNLWIPTTEPPRTAFSRQRSVLLPPQRIFSSALIAPDLEPPARHYSCAGNSGRFSGAKPFLGGPPPPGPPRERSSRSQTLSAALNFALRARGLRSLSSSDAVAGFLVSTRKYLLFIPPSRKASFTMRSSSE